MKITTKIFILITGLFLSGFVFAEGVTVGVYKDSYGEKSYIERSHYFDTLEISTTCTIKNIKQDRVLWEKVFLNSYCDDLLFFGDKIIVAGTTDMELAYGKIFWVFHLDMKGHIKWQSREKYCCDSRISYLSKVSDNTFIAIGLSRGINGNHVLETLFFFV